MRYDTRDNVFFNESTTPLGISATFTGAARSVGTTQYKGHFYAAFNAQVTADQAGTVRIEISNNGTTWYRASADTALSAGGVVILSVPVTAQFYRVVVVNGAAAQTSFFCNTSFTVA